MRVETMTRILLSLFFAAVFTATGAMIHEAYGADTVIALKPGEQFRLQCNGGVMGEPQRSKWRYVIPCLPPNGTTPEPPTPEPPTPEPPTPEPPTSECPKPKYPISEVEKLQSGLELIRVYSSRTVIREFNTRTWTGLTDLSWGPTPAGGNTHQANLTVTVSECRGDMRVKELPRGCVRGGHMSNVQILVGGAGSATCNVDPNKKYYINMAANSILTDKPTCKVNVCNMSVIAANKNVK